MDWILGILTITITPLSTYLAWHLGRRKRNNDFLGDLQSSIDLLTVNYKEALNELTILRCENAELRSSQEILLRQMREMRAENDELKQLVNDLNIKLKQLANR